MKKLLALALLLSATGTLVPGSDAQVVEIQAPLPMYYSPPVAEVYPAVSAYYPVTPALYSPTVAFYPPPPVYFVPPVAYYLPVTTYYKPVVGGRHMSHHWRRKARRGWAVPMVTPY